MNAMRGLSSLFLLSLVLTFVSGQEQFHREVKNPTGPSQIILRGGFLGNSAVPNDVQIVQNQPEQVELSNPPQQALPLQASLDSPIPDDDDEGNPFTNGNSGFGLRLSQQSPGQVQQQPVQQQQQTPITTQQQIPTVTQQQTPTVTQHQPSPIHLQQAPLILPQLPPGQIYVDVYGRPLVFTEQQQPPATAAPPPPPTTPQPVAVQKQAFVDQYGRQLGQIEIQQPVVQVAHNVAQPLVLPNVAQPAFIQNVIQPAAVEVPLLHKAPPPLTLQTYAVPAVRKVGGLVIPYAKKVTVAQTVKDGVILPPSVPAVARVKSKHRTVFSPVKVVAPVAAEVPVVNQVQVHAPAPVLIQEQQQVLVEQPHVAVAHAPQQLVQVAHPQPVAVAHPPVQVVHHVQQPVVQTVAHAAAVPVVEQQHHLVQVAHPPVLAAQPAPVVIKKIKQVPLIEKTIVPEVTLIHQPVLSKVLFQKHIFNVKHGSKPIIYQDLCTVYPYQKNLRACALKKAVLPELHHPDIRTVNVVAVQSQQVPQTDQTIIAGGSSIVSPGPKPEPQPTVPTAPTVTVTKTLPANIQEAIMRESARSKAAAMAQAAAAAATTTAPPSPAQPETAETRESTTSGKNNRRRRKGSSKRNDGFKLV